MKYSIRKKYGDILIYGFITKIQKQTGITSIIPNSEYHYVLWDMDNISYNDVVTNIMDVAEKYGLSNCVIMSDKEKSYRVFSNTRVPFKTLIKILLDTKGVDYMFIKWTVKRDYATIRLSNKKGRDEVKILNVLKYDGVYKPDIEGFKFVEYDTDM